MKTIPAKTILQRNKNNGWFGAEYNMNLYRGCSHGCIYCDSRSECYHIDDFHDIHAKENCLEILRDELRRKVRPGIIGTGAMSDPYNPFEKNEELTRHSLELIDAYEFGIMSLTKSSLIARDKDLYSAISEHSPVLCQVTVTTCDDELSRIIEPYVSTSTERFEALAQLSDAGIFTGVVMTPILPFIEDTEENIKGVLRKAKECGARSVYPMFGLTLRKGQREYFYKKLDEYFGDFKLRDKYEKTYGEKYVCLSRDDRKLWKLFSEECDRLGLIYEMKDIISAYRLGYGDRQLSFFD